MNNITNKKENNMNTRLIKYSKNNNITNPQITFNSIPNIVTYPISYIAVKIAIEYYSHIH